MGYPKIQNWKMQDRKPEVWNMQEQNQGMSLGGMCRTGKCRTIIDASIPHFTVTF